jgi:hypothetical protein
LQVAEKSNAGRKLSNVPARQFKYLHRSLIETNYFALVANDDDGKIKGVEEAGKFNVCGMQI